jgi:membrane-bound lytic murein transglycosylase A
VLALAACAETAKTPDKLSLEAVSFDDLAGWKSDHQAEALPALALSCSAIVKRPEMSQMGVAGKPSDWRQACAGLTIVPAGNDQAARAYFEQYFRPYAASGRAGTEGLFTGYYEADLHGSLVRSERYHVPLYAKPEDLINVDLGLFSDDLKGKHITGKVKDAKLIPYDDRAAIANNSLASRAVVLAWVDDPVDAFFLEVQGSGRIQMDDGHVMQVGYDGANGHAYVAIGRALADMKELPKPVTMQAIRGWLGQHGSRAQEIMNLNPSYVFFRQLNNDGPVGAEGVALTALRSMAVDPAFVPLGTPVWLNTQGGDGIPITRLMVAQDTGGAIKGAVRGDFFWGAGENATRQAGLMQSKGTYFLLLPKQIHVED